MDTFYKNIATLACGGKHLLFGNKTISSQLEEQIKTGSFEDVISDFDPETLNSKENEAVCSITEWLMYEEKILNEALTEEYIKNASKHLSVDRFFILYISSEAYNLTKHISSKAYNLCQLIRGEENLDKFSIERQALQDLK